MIYIDPIPKLAIAVKKLAVMTCIGAALLRKFTALPLKNSICHLTKNAITFYTELRFK
jgi:hypothetical protein